MDKFPLKKKLARMEHKKTRLVLELARTNEIIGALRQELESRDDSSDRGPGVYIIECHGLYKIGKAENLRVRLIDLQIGCPYKLRLVEFIPCGNGENGDLEKAFHKNYSSKRCRGEWFELSHQDLEDIGRIKARRLNGHLLTKFIDDGPFNADAIYSPTTPVDYAITKEIIYTIKTIQKEVGGPAPVGILFEKCEEKGMFREMVKRIVDTLRRDGDIFEPRPGLLKLPLDG